MSSPDQSELVLRSFTGYERAELMPELGVAIDCAGGWVLERRTLSAEALELHVEVQWQALPELYAALLSSGLELTRDSHRAMAERCNCGLHLPRYGLAGILLLRIELHFVPEMTQAGDLARFLPASATA